jgi:hypothetical protein
MEQLKRENESGGPLFDQKRRQSDARFSRRFFKVRRLSHEASILRHNNDGCYECDAKTSNYGHSGHIPRCGWEVVAVVLHVPAGPFDERTPT